MQPYGHVTMRVVLVVQPAVSCPGVAPVCLGSVCPAVGTGGRGQPSSVGRDRPLRGVVVAQVILFAMRARAMAGVMGRVAGTAIRFCPTVALCVIALRLVLVVALG